MKIVVCVKVIKGELNPFDESALECALCLSDDVTVISMSPPGAKAELEKLTRLGAKVIMVSDGVFAGSDTLATSYILSQAIKKLDYDLILCGRQSVDGDTAQVGPMLSQMLSLPVITNAMSVDISGGGVSAVTRLGAERADIPALVTVERGYVLRFPSIFSKQCEIPNWTNADIGCDTARCGLSGSPTRVLQTFENDKGKRKCRFISPKELYPLIEKLKNKRKTTESSVQSDKKLAKVWAVGKEVLEAAGAVAEEVVLIDKSTPQEIAARAMAQNPDVILWNADFWGRKNAPITAAILNTGLCADCTGLETDGHELFMIRPAGGGSITAKIRCLTRPQMATVRTKTESSEIIVSAGRGVKDKLDRICNFCEKIGAEPGASRGLVDDGAAPYGWQIGLTGRIVSPKIYIAVGISGAVHHTCAIEGSGTVIAINPDKDARIFDYADYGILAADEVFTDL